VVADLHRLQLDLGDAVSRRDDQRARPLRVDGEARDRLAGPVVVRIALGAEAGRDVRQPRRPEGAPVVERDAGRGDRVGLGEEEGDSSPAGAEPSTTPSSSAEWTTLPVWGSIAAA
jgi:hypothetical protein